MRGLLQSDLRWLWAAYKMGAYDEVIPQELDDATFTDTVLDIIESSDVAHMIEAHGDKGLQPVGIVLGRTFGRGRCLEPHVDWFPWATPRAKLEGSAVYLREIRRQYKVMLFIEEDTKPFWDRLGLYRLLTRGCKVIDHYGVGKHAWLYYTVGM